MTNQELFKMAVEAKKHSYAPFSNFQVGAALLTKEGKVFTGCNVENSSFGATICAERTAIVKAVSEGYQEFERIAIAATQGEAWPCGMCRQVMMEFCGAEFQIICGEDEGHLQSYSLGVLLPEGFRKDHF